MKDHPPLANTNVEVEIRLIIGESELSGNKGAPTIYID